MREFPLRKWKNVLYIILLEILAVAVAVALRERVETKRLTSGWAEFRWWFGLKEDTVNIVWTKTLFSRLWQTLLQARGDLRYTLRLCYYYVILLVCLFAFVAFEWC